MPNWKGPGEIIDINDTNARIKFKNKVKVLNVANIRKDCFQVKSNLLTDSRFTTHMNIMILN